MDIALLDMMHGVSQGGVSRGENMGMEWFSDCTERLWFYTNTVAMSCNGLPAIIIINAPLILIVREVIIFMQA